jgi:hypothetical protein
MMFPNKYSALKLIIIISRCLCCELCAACETNYSTFEQKLTNKLIKTKILENLFEG